MDFFFAGLSLKIDVRRAIIGNVLAGLRMVECFAYDGLVIQKQVDSSKVVEGKVIKI